MSKCYRSVLREHVVQCSKLEDDNSDSGQDTLVNNQLQVSAEKDAAAKKAAEEAAAVKKAAEEAAATKKAAEEAAAAKKAAEEAAAEKKAAEKATVAKKAAEEAAAANKAFAREAAPKKKSNVKDKAKPPPSSEAWPPYLSLTSTGGAADYQSGALGLYQLSPDSTHEDKPVYKQMDDFDNTRYLWSNSNTWTVSTDVGGGTAWLRAKTRSVHPTTPSWQCREYAGGIYYDDATLTVTGMTQPPPACSLLLSCSYPLPRDMKRPEVLGQYEDTGEYSLGRRVFRHTSRELYLAVGFQSVSLYSYGYGDWVVSSEADVGDMYLRSGSAPSHCPAHTRAANNNHWGVKCWEYRNTRNRWSDLPQLDVTCSTCPIQIS